MQVLVIGGIFFIGLPAALQDYELIPYQKLTWNHILFQALFIIAFPSLIAVYDLVDKGEGTPFPYDPTQNLVQTGVYAYCRNPMQWSFTFAFIPIAIYLGSSAMLLGSFSSIIYSFAVSDPQEYPDMKERFGNTWDTYKSNVPKWLFLWRPNSITKGTIYFDEHCNQCSQISQWFLSKKTIHLEIETANHFPRKHILKATYVDHHSKEYQSVKAIAHCLEHINLAYAALGWFMRCPVISHFLQFIVNSLEIQQIKECDT
ncbi:hypothetical protein OAD66_06145 [Bacteroidia bacterium]|nr:hypothetical protein [Bacteroidia bacterium]MDB9882699.1 hypothetical protein [Bacteroidia bacterium]